MCNEPLPGHSERFDESYLQSNASASLIDRGYPAVYGGLIHAPQRGAASPFDSVHVIGGFADVSLGNYLSSSCSARRALGLLPFADAIA